VLPVGGLCVALDLGKRGVPGDGGDLMCGERLGRPPIKDGLKQRIVAALKAPRRTEGVRKIAQRFGVNASTVQAISREIVVG
jgi:hypothetical protein